MVEVIRLYHLVFRQTGKSYLPDAGLRILEILEEGHFINALREVIGSAAHFRDQQLSLVKIMVDDSNDAIHRLYQAWNGQESVLAYTSRCFYNGTSERAKIYSCHLTVQGAYFSSYGRG